MAENEQVEEIVGNIQTTIFTDNVTEFQAKKYFFTYHIKDDESFESAFLALEGLTVLCDKWIWGEEYGKSGKTPHIQGAFILTGKMRACTIQKHFFKNGVTLRKLKNWGSAFQYCQKEGNKIATSEDIVKLIPLPCERKGDMYPWQRKLYDELVVSECNNKNASLLEYHDILDRKIFWYWSASGCTGKTTFARYLHRKFGFIALSGKASDMKHSIVEYKKCNSCTPRGIVINIPRSVDSDYISYTGIEEIKDMFFFSGKYEGGMVDGNPPHVVIFANEPPDASKMSDDRWCIVNIDVVDPQYDFLEETDDDCEPPAEMIEEINHTVDVLDKAIKAIEINFD